MLAFLSLLPSLLLLTAAPDGASAAPTSRKHHQDVVARRAAAANTDIAHDFDLTLVHSPHLLASRADAASAPAGWKALGCTADSWSRVLRKSMPSVNSVSECLTSCKAAGYTYGGVEYGHECMCDNELHDLQGLTGIASTILSELLGGAQCSMKCSDGSSCGAWWALSLYEAVSETPSTNPPATSSCSVVIAATSTSSSSAATSTSSSTAATSTSSSSVATFTSSSAAAPTASTVVVTPPSSSGSKAVYVHHMLGNTNSYDASMWLADIRQAAAAGFDGFALNIGSDSWQWNQVANAYQAAKDSGLTAFKLFLSFDMTAMPCGSLSDADLLKSYITTYGSHSNQAWYEGKILASTFAGSDCSFGIGGDWSNAWEQAFKTPLASAGKAVFFLPSVFTDPSTFSSVSVMDGELNWGSGWPIGDSAPSFDYDTTYINGLGSSKKYMAAVSPAFFTHYGQNSWNKNWIFQSDGFLYAKRWEILVQNRDKFDLIESLTWNDYGESSYVGPIKGDQPNSQAWVDGFDHTPFLTINNYYATAFKTGSYPAITKDKLFLTARPHVNSATASNDSVGRPTGGQNGPADGYLWPENNFFALVWATAPGTVTLSSGSSTKTVQVAAGVTFLDAPLSADASMSATFTRNGATVASLAPSGFTFTSTPETYNWNYYVYESS